MKTILRVAALLGLMLSLPAWGADLESVRVTGESRAEVYFAIKGEAAEPTLKVSENTVEISFPGVRLGEKLKANSESAAPHALIHRLQSFELENGTTKAKLVMNGTSEKLRDRLAIERVSTGYLLKVDFPKEASRALDLLREEQTPLTKAVTASAVKESSRSSLPLLILCLVLLASGVIGVFAVRYLKKQGRFQGSRKYLVEQLSYCALGPKVGVSLVKVGNDFVLLGVTPGQVNFLSNLPKLQEQYATETSLERKDFKMAVDEEFRRLKPTARGAA